MIQEYRKSVDSVLSYEMVKNLVAAKTEAEAEHINNSANNLNSPFPIRLQYYWLYTHFLIGYKPLEQINNIENLSMTYWVMWWWKTWIRRRFSPVDFIDFTLSVYSILPHWEQKVKEVFLLVKAVTKQLWTLPKPKNLDLFQTLNISQSKNYSNTTPI